MVDVGLSQVIVRLLNRWYRSRSQPRGVLDHSYRGIRLAYNNSYRVVVCLMSLFLLSLAGILFFVPSLFSDKSPAFVLALKIGWAGLLVVILLAPIQAIREFVIVSDEGLMKSNLFSRKTRLEWRDISDLQVKFDENEVTFLTNTKSKLSLCYDGWRDFLETSAKHLSSTRQRQLEAVFADHETA